MSGFSTSGTITANKIVTDTIAESTAGAGVTVDSCLIKDGFVRDSAITPSETNNTASTDADPFITLDIGAVTAGDMLMVVFSYTWTTAPNGIYEERIYPYTGTTATIDSFPGVGSSYPINNFYLSGYAAAAGQRHWVAIVKVTGDGDLILGGISFDESAATPMTGTTANMAAYFMKKQ